MSAVQLPLGQCSAVQSVLWLPAAFGCLVGGGVQLALQACHLIQGSLQALICHLLGLKMPCCLVLDGSQVRLCRHNLQLLLRSIKLGLQL